MSKVSDNSLNELLLSLSGSEKRFVHLYLRNRQGGENHFLRLFKYYVSGKITDAEVLEKIQDAGLKKHLKVNKHYLYAHVLKALRLLHDEIKPEQVVNNLIFEGKLLSEKKLFRQCKSRLRKAEVIAQRHFLFAQLNEITAIRLRVANLETDLEFLEQELEPSYKRIFEWHSAERELLDYQRLGFRNFLLLKTKWVKKGNVLPEFMTSMKKKNPDQLKSPQAKILHAQILSTSWFANAQPSKALAELIRLRKVFQDFPEMQEHFFVQYLACLNNLNILFYDADRLEEMRENLDIMKMLQPASEERSMRVRERWISAEISWLSKVPDREKEKTIIELAKKLTANKFLSPVYRLLFLHESASWEFFRGNYKQALVYLNKVLNETDKKLRPDIQRSARLFNFILHFESGKRDYVRTMLKKVQRYRWNKELEDEFEAWFFVWMKKLCAVTGRTERKKLFQEAATFIENGKQNEYMLEHYLHAFAFERWIKQHNQS